MKTPCEEKGYKVGDRFEVVDYDGDGTFSSGSIIELYRDDESLAPLFKLIKGSCDFYCCGSNAGAYLSLDKVKKIGEACIDTTEEPIKLRVGDYLDLRGHTVTLDLIQKIADVAQKQGHGLLEDVDVLYRWTRDHCVHGVLIQNNGLCSRYDHFDVYRSEFKRKVTLDQWLGSVDNDVSEDENKEEQGMFKLELNDFIDFRSEDVTRELVEKVCEVIVANGYDLDETAGEMHEYLMRDYDGIRIHPYDEDAYIVNIEDYTFNRILKVSDVLGVKYEEESVEIDHVPLLQTIDTLSQAGIRTGSEKITKLVEELSEKAAEKFL